MTITTAYTKKLTDPRSLGDAARYGVERIPPDA
jgi:hypothetical protein